MKKYLYYLIIGCFIFSCNRENDEFNNEKTDLILFQFSEFVSDYSHNNYNNLKSAFNINDLLVDNEKIKGMIFYNSIVLDEKELLPVRENEDINPTDLEKRILIESLNSYLEDDIYVFIDKMEYFKIFIDENISDIYNLTYIIISLERFKWLKYAQYETHLLKSGHAFDACFDDCMEQQIEDQFDWWGGWIQFWTAPAVNLAFMTAECTWGCATS